MASSLLLWMFFERSQSLIMPFVTRYCNRQTGMINEFLMATIKYVPGRHCLFGAFTGNWTSLTSQIGLGGSSPHLAKNAVSG